MGYRHCMCVPVASLYVCSVCVHDDCLYDCPLMKWMHPTVCPRVSCLCTSSDHEYVDGYRVQIVHAPPPRQTMTCKTCESLLGNAFTIQHDVAFDSKVSWLTALMKKRTVADTAYIVHALSFCSSSL